MTTPVTSKSTKSDIWDAYEGMLKEIKELKKSSRKEIQEEENKQTIVAIARKDSIEEILKNITELKLKSSRLLEEVGEKILAEHDRLKILQQAIAIETQKLKEKHDINTNANTLEALLLAQTRQKEAFEKEMKEKRDQLDHDINETRTAWKEEQALYTRYQEEEKTARKKARQREEEEYQYNLTLQRQKLTDDYEQAKATQARELEEKREVVERDLKEREEALFQAEKELQDLRKQVETFPKTLEDSIKQAKEQAVLMLKKDYEFKAQLTEKEFLGEQKVNQQMILAQEGKIQELQATIAALSKKADSAGQQVETIAIKAIEGASGIKQHYEKMRHYQEQQKENRHQEEVR